MFPEKIAKLRLLILADGIRHFGYDSRIYKVVEIGPNSRGQITTGTGLPTNLTCHAVTAGADSPVSRLCTGRIRA